MAQLDRILIVGGGIAGLSLAAALHQQGFRAELIERSPIWETVGAGIAMQPNGTRVLRRLGLSAAVEEAGTVIHYWDFCDQQGQVLCETDLNGLWQDSGPFIGIARSKLQQALLAGAASTPARLGTSVLSLTQDDWHVSVRFSDGTVSDYDLVVGADGIDSTVRKLTLNQAPPVYAGQMTWRSLVPIRPHGLTKLQFLLGDGCFFGLCPVGNGHTYGFANVTEPRFRDVVEGRRERLRERFTAFGEIVQDYLAALQSDEQIHCSAVEWVEQEEWYSGRVLLIGDAAHASSPLMGQGGCMALEDDYVLAEVLRSAPNLESALNAYVTKRTPRVQWVQQQSRTVAQSFLLPPTVRNAALRERGNRLMQERYSPLIASISERPAC